MRWFIFNFWCWCWLLRFDDGLNGWLRLKMDGFRVWLLRCKSRGRNHKCWSDVDQEVVCIRRLQ